jgi:hypothetical protein
MLNLGGTLFKVRYNSTSQADRTLTAPDSPKVNPLLTT